MWARAGLGRRGGAGAVTASSRLGGAGRGGRGRAGPPAGRGGGGDAGFGAALPCPALPRPAAPGASAARSRRSLSGPWGTPEDGHGSPRTVRPGPGAAWGRELSVRIGRSAGLLARGASTACANCWGLTGLSHLRYCGVAALSTKGRNVRVQNSAWFVRSAGNKERGTSQWLYAYRHVCFATGNSETESLEGFILTCPKQSISCSPPVPVCHLHMHVLVHIFWAAYPKAGGFLAFFVSRGVSLTLGQIPLKGSSGSAPLLTAPCEHLGRSRQVTKWWMVISSCSNIALTVSSTWSLPQNAFSAVYFFFSMCA